MSEIFSSSKNVFCVGFESKVSMEFLRINYIFRKDEKATKKMPRDEELRGEKFSTFIEMEK